MAKLRKLGDILLDIETYILELADHDLQWGDYDGLLFRYLEVHLRCQQEKFKDGSRPIRFYGHKDDLIRLGKELEREKKRSRK